MEAPLSGVVRARGRSRGKPDSDSALSDVNCDGACNLGGVVLLSDLSWRSLLPMGVVTMSLGGQFSISTAELRGTRD